MDFAIANYAPGNQVGSNRIPKGLRSIFVASSSNPSICTFSNDAGHFISYCQNFKTRSPANRLQEAKRLGLCKTVPGFSFPVELYSIRAPNCFNNVPICKSASNKENKIFSICNWNRRFQFCDGWSLGQYYDSVPNFRILSQHYRSHCSEHNRATAYLQRRHRLLRESYQQAYRKFLSLERKLNRQPALKAHYAAFIKEYLDLGHMSSVSAADIGLCRYNLPLTKLRLVFDGSAGSSSNYSLNDVLMAGPVIQPKLFQILLRFRSHPGAITGDICKMYRCVRVQPEDSHLQCISWRDYPQDQLRVLKHSSRF